MEEARLKGNDPARQDPGNIRNKIKVNYAGSVGVAVSQHYLACVGIIRKELEQI